MVAAEAGGGVHAPRRSQPSVSPGCGCLGGAGGGGDWSSRRVAMLGCLARVVETSRAGLCRSIQGGNTCMVNVNDWIDRGG